MRGTWMVAGINIIVCGIRYGENKDTGLGGDEGQPWV